MPVCLRKYDRVSAQGRGTTWRGRFVCILAWVLAGCACGGLAFAYLLQDLGEESRIGNLLMWVAFMGRTFTFHAGVGLAALATLMAVFRLKRQAAAMALPAALAMVPVARSYVPKNRASLAEGTITVMSCNLLVGSGSEQRAGEEVLRVDPDIVLFQEYSAMAHAVLAPMLGPRYPHRTVATREDAFGQAVYSKLEPVGGAERYPHAVPSRETAGRPSANPELPQIRIVVRVRGREVVVQNVHTLPPVTPTRLAEQRALLAWLGESVRDKKRPVIMGGDFNATHESLGVLHRAGMECAFAMAGRGRETTWPDLGLLRHLPGVGIDHVLVGKGLVCELSRVGDSIGSDHRPVITRVGFGRTP